MTAGTRWDLGGRDVDALYSVAQRIQSETPAARSWRRLRRDRPAWIAWCLLCVIAVGSLAAPLLPLPSPKTMRLTDRRPEPVWPWLDKSKLEFRADYWDPNPLDAGLAELRSRLFGKYQTGPWLGTDERGRDLLARIVWATRKSLVLALAAAALGVSIGAAWGAWAASRGGATERRMMRVADLARSLPAVLLAIATLALLDAPRGGGGQGLIDRELVFCALLGAAFWAAPARAVRERVLALKDSEFVLWARANGASTGWILRRHVWPNALPTVIACLTVALPAVLLAETSLSFVGLGVQAPELSLGTLMAAGVGALDALQVRWWLFAFPAAALTAILLALHVLGRGVRDALGVRGAEGATP